MRTVPPLGRLALDNVHKADAARGIRAVENACAIQGRKGEGTQQLAVYGDQEVDLCLDYELSELRVRESPP